MMEKDCHQAQGVDFGLGRASLGRIDLLQLVKGPSSLVPRFDGFALEVPFNADAVEVSVVAVVQP